MNTLVIDEKSLSVGMLPRNKKKHRDVKLLYDVVADTIGYTVYKKKMNAARLKFARIHARSTHVPFWLQDIVLKDWYNNINFTIGIYLNGL